MAIILAGYPNRRCIDDGGHLLKMIEHQTVEKYLVAILQPHQEDIAFDWRLFTPVIFVGSRDLLLDTRNMRRKEAEQAKLPPFIFGEGATFIQHRIIEKIVSALRYFYLWFACH